MSHNLTSLYLSSLVPQSVSNISRYSLRNSNDLQTIDARTTLYYNSFLPSTVRAWNNVHEEAKQSDSFNTFKYFLNKDKMCIPKHFYVVSRKTQVLCTRLRTNCSSLNLDPPQVLSDPTNRALEYGVTVSNFLAVSPFVWQ